MTPQTGASREIDAIIANMAGWRGATLARLREIVLGADSAIVEEVKWKMPSKPEGVPVWSVDGIVCIGETLKNAVRLTFPKGAELPDPDQIFNARLTSNTVRAVDFAAGQAPPGSALGTLIAAAVSLNSERAAQRARR